MAMKIMIVTNNFTPYSGGVVSSIKALTHELHKAHHEVKVVTLGFLKDHSDDPAWIDRIYCPVRFAYKNNRMAIPWRARAHISRALDEFKPDIVHLHHPFLLGPLALKESKKRNIPTIFTYHTLYEAYTHYVPLPLWLTRWYIKHKVTAFCQQVDGIVAPSSYMRNIITQSVATPVTVIPSGLLPEFKGAQLIKQVNNRPIKLLVVSRMVKEKNLKVVLEVAKRLHNYQIPFELKLIGYGSEYDNLKQYAYDNLKLNPSQVVFVHKPPKEIIAQAYQDADLFLFPSHTDTQGLVLAEAMAYSTPVLALDGPGQRDIIKKGLNGYIVDTPEQMVHKIHSITHNSSLPILSAGAYNTAQRYRAEMIAKRYVDFYRSVTEVQLQLVK